MTKLQLTDEKKILIVTNKTIYTLSVKKEQSNLIYLWIKVDLIGPISQEKNMYLVSFCLLPPYGLN